jgi:hypothetical protein
MHTASSVSSVMSLTRSGWKTGRRASGRRAGAVSVVLTISAP